MRNRVSLNAIAITGREKKPAGIDFDIPVQRKERKSKKTETEQPELFEPVYLEEHYEAYKKTKNKNLFEEVIEKMMLESCYDESFQPYIEEIREIIAKKMPVHKKRFAILCTLDKNRNLMRKAKIYQDGNISMMEHIKDYVQILRKYVRVSEVEKKKFGEVMTPIELVTEMLNKLPREVWSNPNLKWLDPCNGVGPFGALVVAGLMKGLAKWEPDEEKRYRHIMQNMVYVCELQPKNVFLWLSLMDPQDRYDMNVYCGSFLDAGFDKHMKEVWCVDKFDIIVGNPPYNEEFKEDNNRAKTLYNVFIERSLPMCDKLLFITPSRWMTGGFGLDDFRSLMFARKDLKLIKHFDLASTIFKDVDIKGGVSYFLIDNEYIGNVLYNDVYCNLKKYDIFVEPKYHDLLNKVVNGDNLSSMIKSKSYWMNFNDNTLSLEKNENNFTCYVSQSKGLKKYINVKDITKSSIKDIKKYKVFTPYASGSNGNLGYFGNKIIGFPDEVCSNSYMTLFVSSEEEAKSLISYMDTKFCNFFLSLRKNTQNMKPDTLSWIPLVPFDREWTDEKLFKYFDLTTEEKQLILNK